MRRSLVIALLGIAGIGISAAYPWAYANDNEPNVKLKTHFLYNFAKLVDWPSTYKQGDFVFGIYGETKVYEELQTIYASRTVGSQPIKVKNFTSLNDVSDCHILYISQKESAQAKNIVKQTKKNTLVVTDGKTALEKGVVINFVIHENKQAYELSKANAENRELIVAQTLTSLAVRVE